MEKTNACVVYHICREGDVGNLEAGYIGISSEYEERWSRHKAGYSGSVIVNRAYEKYDDIVENIVVIGSKEYCQEIEGKLRPSERMGWNIARGGGLPPNLSGKVMSNEQKAKIGKSNGGQNNMKWKGYWVIDGVEYESMTIAAKAIGCCKKSIRDRTLSDKFPNYAFKPAATAANRLKD